MRRPGNRVRLPRARRVLDQISAPRPLRAHGSRELSRRVQLVIARKGQAGDRTLGVALGGDVAADDLEPALTLEDLLPEISRAVPARVRRVAAAAIVALVEGKEVRLGAGELRRHVHFAV